MMDKLLSTEYKQNPSNRSGASEAHIRTERQTSFQKPPFRFREGGGVLFVIVKLSYVRKLRT
jgi:hypothetical protein